MDIRKEIRAIQTGAEKELGFPLAKVVWQRIEEQIGNSLEDFEGDPEGEEQFIKSYESVTRNHIDVLQIALSQGKARTTASKNNESAQTKKTYRKCFERRFYLVNYVLDSSYKRGSRIDWKCTAVEWNKAHPSDQMTAGTLRVEYKRAKKEVALMSQVHIIRYKYKLEKLVQKLKDTGLYRSHQPSKGSV